MGMKKRTELWEAIATVANGDCVGLGGNTLNRPPMAAVFELIRQRKRGLRIVKTAGAMDIDALCLAGCVASVDAGFVGYESRYGLAPRYRKRVQAGEIAANEHACYTVISALRAASYGIPFMPVAGLKDSGSDLRRVNGDFAEVVDPFGGGTLAAVRAIRPDVAILHAHLADERGNALIEGPKYEDVLLSRAAKRVILTAERIVGDGCFEASARKPDIPHFLVSAVAHVPRGAAPCACFGHYEPDGPRIEAFLHADDDAALQMLSDACCRVPAAWGKGAEHG
jgi:glutaconate CoA-transferase subunit A